MNIKLLAQASEAQVGKNCTGTAGRPNVRPALKNCFANLQGAERL